MNLNNRVSVVLVISILLNVLLITTGGYYYFRCKNLTVKDIIAYSNKVNLHNELSRNKANIVFFGDSLTANCEWSEFFNGAVNRGIGGDTTEGMLKRLQTITDTKPSKIFIMIGTNDLTNGRSVSDILTTYTKIIETIQQQSPNTKIYVQSVLPVGAKYVKKNTDIMVLNEKLHQMATNNIVYINLHPAFLDGKSLNPKYAADGGTHLNPNGYVLWKSLIEQHVN